MYYTDSTRYGEGSVHLEKLPVNRLPIFRPWPLVTVAVFVLNDHWLKAQFHNEITGKLSDVTGLFFFPLLLYSFGIWMSEFVGSGLSDRHKRWLAIASTAITSIVFVLINTMQTFDQLYENLRETWFAWQLIPRPGPHTLDYTDLWTLPAAALAYWYMRRGVGAT